MNHSEHMDLWAAAFAKAQGEIRGAVKNAKNPHFRSDYSTLEAVCDAIRGPLSSHGLSHSEDVGMIVDGMVMIHTTIWHESGQYKTSVSAWHVPKASPQAQASAVTYGRRNALLGAVGVAPIEDDDGNAASASRTPQEAAQAILTPQQCAALKGLLGELPGETTVNFLRALNVADVESVPAGRYDWACQALRKKIQEKAIADAKSEA